MANSAVSTIEVRQADIVSGRGRSYSKHPGNLRFDEIIKQNLRRYFSVTTHADKKKISEEIVDELTSLEGRFLQYDKRVDKWIVMNRESSRIKVALALQYRQRRVAKGLERIDDTLEPLPCPLPDPGKQLEYQPTPPSATSLYGQTSVPLPGFEDSHQEICAWEAVDRQYPSGGTEPHQDADLSGTTASEQLEVPTIDDTSDDGLWTPERIANLCTIDDCHLSLTNNAATVSPIPSSVSDHPADRSDVSPKHSYGIGLSMEQPPPPRVCCGDNNDSIVTEDDGPISFDSDTNNKIEDDELSFLRPMRLAFLTSEKGYWQQEHKSVLFHATNADDASLFSDIMTDDDEEEEMEDGPLKMPVSAYSV